MFFSDETSAKTGAGLGDNENFMQTVLTTAAKVAATRAAATSGISAPAPTQTANTSPAIITESLLAKKEAFTTNLSDYKIKRATEHNYNPFGFSKEDKINAATKVMAYFYGADNAALSNNELAALVEEGSKLERALTASLGLPDRTQVALMQCFKQTRDAAKALTQNTKTRCNQALIQFLKDYIAIREANPDGHYFFKAGCPRQDKLDAANKLVRRLQNPESDETFEPKEIIALNDGKLKETIQTTLGWFKNAQSFENFMIPYGAGPGHLKVAHLGTPVIMQVS